MAKRVIQVCAVDGAGKVLITRLGVAARCWACGGSKAPPCPSNKGTKDGIDKRKNP